MNIGELRAAALALDEQLRLALETGNPQVVLFRAAVEPLVKQALDGNVSSAMDWRDIPGAWYFTEGQLGAISELETAFANFRLALSGAAESPVLAALRESLRNPP